MSKKPDPKAVFGELNLQISNPFFSEPLRPQSPPKE